MLAIPTTEGAVEAPDTELQSLERLEEEIAALASHLDAATCQWLELLAEFDRRDGSARAEFGSLAQWLTWRCAVAPAAARELVRVAGCLEGLPQIRAAFGRGELSYAKVRELTRVADAESEEALLELAAALSVPQLQRALGVYCRVITEEALRTQRSERLVWFWDDDGSLVLRARLSPEDGALVVRALEQAREAARERRTPLDTPATPSGWQPPIVANDPIPRVEEEGCSNVDALVTIADLALASDEARAAGDRSQLVVHVDAETLVADEPGRCGLESGRPLAAETARRLGCDAALVPMIERDGEPLTLGRKRRTIPPALRRALRARDQGCRFPGCQNNRFVDAHHVQHWARGGETNLDNLLLLCRRHHRAVHEGGYTVDVAADGEARFTNRYGVRIPNTPRPPPGGLPSLLETHRQAGLEIGGHTGRYGDGEPFDLTAAADALFDILRPARAT
jgi:hypothetical protein